MDFNDLFKSSFPIIGCIHLQPLPGSPSYSGDLERVRSQALQETMLLVQGGVSGLIIENFGDAPFYKDKVPVSTVACMASIARDIKKQVNIPIGINVLRNDAAAAVSIAHAVGAEFIRVNIHMHAMVTDQGIIEGKSYETLRLKKQLQADVKIFVDVNVKHASPLVEVDLIQTVEDLVYRGKADALIVTGSGTGKGIDIKELQTVSRLDIAPVMIGSGVTSDNIAQLKDHADGAIIGSYFKENGLVSNRVDQSRIAKFMKYYAGNYTGN